MTKREIKNDYFEGFNFQVTMEDYGAGDVIKDNKLPLDEEIYDELLLAFIIASYISKTKERGLDGCSRVMFDELKNRFEDYDLYDGLDCGYSDCNRTTWICNVFLHKEGKEYEIDYSDISEDDILDVVNNGDILKNKIKELIK